MELLNKGELKTKLSDTTFAETWKHIPIFY